MVELDSSQYERVRAFVGRLEEDPIFPYAVVEKKQRGRIFVDDLEEIGNVIIWHYCGFAYVIGNGKNEVFNQALIKLTEGNFEEDQRRFVLGVHNKKWEAMIEQNATSIVKRKQLLFKFNEEHYEPSLFNIPKPYTIRQIDKQLLERLKGRIIPSFSWDSPEAFLKAGKGYCLMDGEQVVCTSFSSCIADGKVDIGIETTLEYRGKGLGSLTASRMVKEVLAQGYEPDWRCDDQNKGSAAIAKRLGFEESGYFHIYIKA